MTYDDSVYYMVVTMQYDAQGSMVASGAYYDDKDLTREVRVARFFNHYKDAPTPAMIIAKKKLIGKDMEAGMYTFELVEAEGNVVATATNNAQGGVVFVLNYQQPGVYNYTVREVSGTDPNTTYDDTVYRVSVIVTDNQLGNLVAGVAYVDGEIVFTNVYEEVEETEPSEEPEDTEPSEEPDESTTPEPTEPSEEPEETTTPEPSEEPTTPAPTTPSNPDVPDTGDNAPIALYAVLMLASALAIVVLLMGEHSKGGRYTRKSGK